MDQTNLRERLIRALAKTHLEPPRPLAHRGLSAELGRRLGLDVTQLRPAAVLVPVIDSPGALRVLFTVRAPHLRKHAGQISFPGGAREGVDRDAIETALRESREEVGLAPSRVRIVGYLDDYATITGFRVTPVVGLIDPSSTVAPDGVEITETFDVPLSQLVQRRHYKRETIHHEGLALSYHAIDHGDYRIWGATAGMLRNLIDKLERTSCKVPEFSYTGR